MEPARDVREMQQMMNDFQPFNQRSTRNNNRGGRERGRGRGRGGRGRAQRPGQGQKRQNNDYVQNYKGYNNHYNDYNDINDEYRMNNNGYHGNGRGRMQRGGYRGGGYHDRDYNNNNHRGHRMGAGVRGRGRGRGGRGRVRGRGRRRGRGRGGRGRGRRQQRKEAIPAPEPKGNFVCAPSEEKESKYANLFKKCELNANKIPPLYSIGCEVDGVRIQPDRHGRCQFQVKFNTNFHKSLNEFLKAIVNFVKMVGKKPYRITCKINEIGGQRMNWHLHYDRKNWIDIIQKNKDMNVISKDISTKEEMLGLFEKIDVFKHWYTVKASENEREGIENQEERVNELGNSEIIAAIDNSNFDFETFQGRCRVSKKLKEKEFELQMNEMFFAGIELKKCKDYRIAFRRHTIIGMDIGSNTLFIGLTPAIYFMALADEERSDFNDDFVKFMKSVAQKAVSFFDKKEKIMKQTMGEKKYNELVNYCTKYHTAHPDLFVWPKQRKNEPNSTKDTAQDSQNSN